MNSNTNNTNQRLRRGRLPSRSRLLGVRVPRAVRARVSRRVNRPQGETQSNNAPQVGVQPPATVVGGGDRAAAPVSEPIHAPPSARRAAAANPGALNDGNEGNALNSRQDLVRKHVKNYEIWLEKDDLELSKKLVHFRIRNRVTSRPGKNNNKHAVSGLVREMANVKALKFVDEVDVVLDYCASPRTEELLNRVQRGCSDPIPYRAINPIISPKDILRRVREGACVNDLDNFRRKLVLLNDVYALQGKPLTARNLSELFRSQDICVWIGHHFNGEVGTIFDEGGWIRLQGPDGDKIISKPDVESDPYGPHDPCDWMRVRNYEHISANETLMWAKAWERDSYKVVVFTKVPRQEFADDQNRVDPRYVKCDIMNVSSWWSRFRLSHKWVNYCSNKFFPESTLRALVDKTLLHKLTMKVQGRRRDPLLWSTLKTEADSFCTQDAGYQLLIQLFPDSMKQVPFYTALLAYTTTAADEAALISAALDSHGDGILDQAKMVQELDWNKLTYSESKWYRYLKWMFVSAAAVGVGAVFKLVTTLFKLYRAKFASLFSLRDFITAVIIAPLSEESVKRIHPFVTWYIVAFELIGHIIKEGPKVIIGYIPALCMHFWCANQPWKVGVLAHALFNLSILISEGSLVQAYLSMFFWVFYWNRHFKKGSLFSVFKQRFYQSDWAQRDSPLLDDDVVREDFSPEESFVPSEMTPFCTQKPQCPDTIIRSDFIEVPEESKFGCYWLLPTNVPGYMPGRSVANLECMISNRITAIHPKYREGRPVDIRYNFDWAEVKLPLWKTWPEIDRNWCLPHWLAHLEPCKRKKYLKIHEDVINGHVIPDHRFDIISLMVKTDELLMKMENGKMALKPRPIFNVHPEAQYVIGPEIYEAQLRMKSTWSINSPPAFIKRIRGLNGVVLHRINVHVTYASGFTDEDLSEWFRWVQMMSGVNFFILVSGDDSLCVLSNNGSRLFIEGDGSQFDASQGSGARDFACRVLKLFGVSDKVLGHVVQLYGATLKAFSKKAELTGKAVITRTARPQLPTGFSGTHCCNSAVAAGSWCHWVQKLTYLPLSAGMLNFESFNDLGLEMKIKISESVEDTTFLKGTWYPVEGGYMDRFSHYWGPLPSRILKIGKSIRDPCQLYRSMSKRKAGRQFLVDQANAIRYFIRVPVLRAFVERFGYAPAVRHFVEEYKVQAAVGVNKPYPEVDLQFAFMYRRYNLSEDEIYKMEEMIESSDAYTFLKHPGFLKLVLADYA